MVHPPISHLSECLYLEEQQWVQLERKTNTAFQAIRTALSFNPTIPFFPRGRQWAMFCTQCTFHNVQWRTRHKYRTESQMRDWFTEQNQRDTQLDGSTRIFSFNNLLLEIRRRKKKKPTDWTLSPFRSAPRGVCKSWSVICWWGCLLTRLSVHLEKRCGEVTSNM